MRVLSFLVVPVVLLSGCASGPGPATAVKRANESRNAVHRAIAIGMLSQSTTFRDFEHLHGREFTGTESDVAYLRKLLSPERIGQEFKAANGSPQHGWESVCAAVDVASASAYMEFRDALLSLYSECYKRLLGECATYRAMEVQFVGPQNDPKNPETMSERNTEKLLWARHAFSGLPEVMNSIYDAMAENRDTDALLVLFRNIAPRDHEGYSREVLARLQEEILRTLAPSQSWLSDDAWRPVVCRLATEAQSTGDYLASNRQAVDMVLDVLPLDPACSYSSMAQYGDILSSAISVSQENPFPGTRQFALWRLSYVHDRRAVAQVVRSLGDPDPKVRDKARSLLDRIAQLCDWYQELAPQSAPNGPLPK